MNFLPRWYVPPHLRTPPKHPVDNYLKAAANEFGFTVLDLKSKRKPKDLALARHVAWYVVRKNRPDLSLPIIARKTNYADHTSVLHGVKRIEGLIEYRPDVKEAVDRVEYAVRSGAL